MAIDKRKRQKRSSRNKGVQVGPRDLFTPSNVRRIRALLAKRLKTLKGLTPYEYVYKVWTLEPERFKLNPIHHTPGLNS